MQKTQEDPRTTLIRKKGYVTPNEASEMTKTPLQTIYTWVRNEQIETTRVGKRIFVSLKSLAKIVGPLITVGTPTERGQR